MLIHGSKESQGWTVNGGSLIASPHFNVAIVHEHHLFFGLLVQTDSRSEKELLFGFPSATLEIVYEICLNCHSKWPHIIYFTAVIFFFFCIKLWARQQITFPTSLGDRLLKFTTSVCCLDFPFFFFFFNSKLRSRKCNEDR